MPSGPTADLGSAPASSRRPRIADDLGREREHMLNHPRLLIDSVREREQDRPAARLKDGPGLDPVSRTGWGVILKSDR